MPRNKKAADESRPHRINFRLTGAELAALCRQAEEAGLSSPHEYARLKATGEADCPAPLVRVQGTPASAGVAFQIQQQLIRVGVNLNQIARRLNMTGEHEPSELVRASQDLDDILRRILAEVRFS